MTPDRMATVLRIRELTERRRLAEHVASLRAAEVARGDHAAARAARLDADLAPGASVDPHKLLGARLEGMALAEVVDVALENHEVAKRAAAAAERSLIAASIARRSAERLQERRAAAAAELEQRAAIRRADDVALQQWRLRS